MTGISEFDAAGLKLELTPRRMRGPLVPGGRPRRWLRWAGVPALVLMCALLIAPAVWTVWTAAEARPQVVSSCGVLAVACVGLTLILRPGQRVELRIASGSGLAVVAVAALWFLGAALTEDGLWAYLRTLVWVAFAIVLLASALALAWWSRNARWVWAPLIVPFGISAFVSGVAFRLIFEFLAARLGIDTVGGYRFWYAAMLGSAFLWTWLGFLTGLLRADIQAIENDSVCAGYLHDPADGARSTGGALSARFHTRARFVGRLLALVRPVLLVVGLVVGVAAARVFDVVLIGVPGSMQYEVDSATVHWWRLATDADLGPGVAAAYSLPLTLVVGLVAWLLQIGMQSHRRRRDTTTKPASATGRTRFEPIRAVGIAVVSSAALIPIAVLIGVCLVTPSGFAFSAFSTIFRDEALRHAWQITAWVATMATLIVVSAALPVAYRLAALRPEGVASKLAVVTLVVLSVLPAQTYLGALDTFIDEYGLSGTRIPLIFVHVAAGLPIAVLILRGALLAPPGSPANDELYGLATSETTLRRLWTSAGPALVAVAVLEFIQVWNDFFIGLMMSGAGASPWSLLLWGGVRRFNESSAELAAGALVSAALPVLLLLLTWRRWLVPGLTGGVSR
ncbi:hypothetical protein [Nocardia noduli]|uniref:hypothetical protein n=1 Tax=Nocardia noduli TaxID=2815722 RepID=UPI001C22DF2A|nr:hypothetical protein [Nocardia noduli]